MFYKVIYNEKVVDVLDRLVYLKYQKKHNRMVFCDESEAQAVFSSDENEIWHVDGFYNLPVDGYETVKLVEIDIFEYKRLKALNCMTMEDIIDEFTRSLIKGDSSIISHSLKRLYLCKEIDEDMVIKLCEQYKISEDIKMSILSGV